MKKKRREYTERGMIREKDTMMDRYSVCCSQRKRGCVIEGGTDSEERKKREEEEKSGRQVEKRE